jgi:hypothetical protein
MSLKAFKCFTRLALTHEMVYDQTAMALPVMFALFFKA